MGNPEIDGENYTSKARERIREAFWENSGWIPEGQKIPVINGQVPGRPTQEAIGYPAGAFETVAPLIKRGGADSEIAEITSYTSEQVRAIGDDERLCGVVKKREMRERAYQRRREINCGVMLENERVNILIARKILQEGLIGEDITRWEALHRAFGRGEKDLQDDFAYKLVLESLLIALEKAKHGNLGLLERFNQIVGSVDKKLPIKGRLIRDGRILKSSLKCGYQLFKA